MNVYIWLLITFGICSLLQRLYGKPFNKRIRNAENMDEAMFWRGRLKKFRFTFITTFIVLFLMPWVLDCSLSLIVDRSPMSVLTVVIGVPMLAIICCIYFIRNKKFDKLMGTISTLRKDDYLSQHSHYTLYLRAFERDSYGSQKPPKGCFFEKEFMRLLGNADNVCAVGMPKEIDCPAGVQRIYIDFEDWKDDVHELMLKADRIYILVNDRESCAWEIEQSIELLSKTTFIVDSDKEYNGIMTRLSLYSHFPEINDLAVGRIAVASWKDGEFYLREFDNSINGYAEALSVTLPKDYFVSSRKCIGCGCLLSIFISGIVSMLCNVVLDEIMSEDCKNLLPISIGFLVMICSPIMMKSIVNIRRRRHYQRKI